MQATNHLFQQPSIFAPSNFVYPTWGGQAARVAGKQWGWGEAAGFGDGGDYIKYLNKPNFTCQEALERIIFSKLWIFRWFEA